MEAVPVDEELADQVWETWDARVITDDLAAVDDVRRHGGQCHFAFFFSFSGAC